MDIVNAVKSSMLSVASELTPILKESKFKETGVLTPEEFVLAGDHLVHHCPTWHWASAAADDSSKTKPYLPKDKQYLITKNVPCYRRCAHIDYDKSLEKVIRVENSSGDEETWVDTHHYAAAHLDLGLDAAVSEMDLNDQKKHVETGKQPENVDCDENDDDGPAVDMDDLLSQLEDNDPNTLLSSEVDKSNGPVHSNRVETRTYNLNITYDRYYQVPRLWLVGFDEGGLALGVSQMYSDFSAEHAGKTITMETHPHLAGKPNMASIHPCRHAEVMKRLIEQIASAGRELDVRQYLLIFLKFVQAIIPTIEYDYTRSVEL